MALRGIEDRLIEWLEDPRRVVLAAILVIGVPVLVLGEISALDTRGRIRQAELDAASAAAERASAVASGRLGKSMQLTAATAASFDLQNALQARDQAVLSSKANEIRVSLGADAAEVTIVDVSGIPLEGTPSAPFADGTYFKRAKERQETTVGVVDARPGESQRIAIAAPVRRSVNPFIGAVIVEIRLRDIAEWLQPSLTPSADIYVLDDRGRLLTQASAPGQDIRDVSDRPATVAALATQRSAFEGNDPVLGSRRFLGVAPLDDLPWRVMASRSPDLLETELGATLNQLLALRVALVAVALIAAFLVGRGAQQLGRQRRALATVNFELADATAAKSRFLASMSHDLRTPLNAIIGFSEVLETEAFGPLNEKQKDYVADIVSSGKLQLQLVNEILDLSKIEAGKMDFAPQEFDLAEVLRGVHSVVSALATSKAQELALQIDEDIPLMYQDPVRVKQIVFNLLGNAVKFTPEGGRITTRVNVDGGDRVEIAVSDTGVGLAPDEVANVFTEFERVGAEYSRKQQGSGLGLALVKRFTEMMGGSVSVSSLLGQGSTFTVRLPVRQP